MYRLNLVLREDLRRFYADAASRLGVSYSDVLRMSLERNASAAALHETYPCLSGRLCDIPPLQTGGPK